MCNFFSDLMAAGYDLFCKFSNAVKCKQFKFIFILKTFQWNSKVYVFQNVFILLVMLMASVQCILVVKWYADAYLLYLHNANTPFERNAFFREMWGQQTSIKLHSWRQEQCINIFHSSPWVTMHFVNACEECYSIHHLISVRCNLAQLTPLRLTLHFIHLIRHR